MTRKIAFPILTVFFVALLTSFIVVDFNKTLVGKWELKTIQRPGKEPMDTKPILGESFMEFKADHTYLESGESTSKGTWQITEGKYLQTQEDGSTLSQKMELKEIAPDKFQVTSPDKTSLVYAKVK